MKKCNEDCFNCQYSDCILDESEARALDKKAKRRAYLEANKEHIKQVRHEWYMRHQSELKKRSLERYYANHEEGKRRRREYYHRTRGNNEQLRMGDKP